MNPFNSIESVCLHTLLPLVFKGEEASDAIQQSLIWLKPDVTFQRGCRICIQAESGRGKSSLLSYIYGNRNDYGGDIIIGQDNAREFGIAEWCLLRSEHISLLPQEMRLFGELTVMQNIEIKNQRTKHKTPQQIVSLLNKLGIEEKKDVPVAKLSIGQQQRVAIIRALCQPFDFIFLDEPVSHLDERNNRIVAEIIEEEAASHEAGIITTSVGNHLLLENAHFIRL